LLVANSSDVIPGSLPYYVQSPFTVAGNVG
jgi:hypothetical protein